MLRLLRSETLPHRRPVAGVNNDTLQKGAEILYRPKRGQDPVKMRVISPGLPWVEPMPGSSEVTKKDIDDRDGLVKAWGSSFDPVKMYTVLCSADWTNDDVVRILYFPNVGVQNALPKYAHRAFRQMCGGIAGRGCSVATATRRCTIAGPNNVRFDYTEFPDEAYSRPKRSHAEANADPPPPKPAVRAQDPPPHVPGFSTKGAPSKKHEVRFLFSLSVALRLC